MSLPNTVDHLDDLSLEELQAALEDVEGSKPTQRLLAAIAYKNGVTQTELADWYGVQRRTIYSWLTRLDTDDPLADAVTDAPRPGRKRKLSEAELEAFRETVRDPPTDAGIDEPAWTPALARQYLADTYDVEYSIPSCRRLLKEAGLQYRPSSGPDADERISSADARPRRDGRWTPE
ncbi:transposase [Natronococcus occultus SP4]|uniref:Transposase n=1 Tax=Natronococcus occultus SP4 TaxID=694430 RepID=L0K3E7_9EURY|nr:transposase [Natronococcus occultus SP4]